MRSGGLVGEQRGGGGALATAMGVPLSPVPARSKVYRGFNFTFPQPIRVSLRLRTLTHSEKLTVALRLASTDSLVHFVPSFCLFSPTAFLFIFKAAYLFVLHHREKK